MTTDNNQYTRQNYMIVLNRETFEGETWAYGGYEEYRIEPSTNIYIGCNLGDMEKFIENYFYNTAQLWCQANLPMFRHGYQGHINDRVVDKFLSLVFVDISRLLRAEDGVFNNSDRNYSGSNWFCEEFCDEIFHHTSSPEDFVRKACFAALFRFGQEWKQIAEENKKSEEKVKKAKETEQKLEQESTERATYERLKAKFDSNSTPEGKEIS